jgi:hypothetical protein
MVFMTYYFVNLPEAEGSLTIFYGGRSLLGSNAQAAGRLHPDPEVIRYR